MISFIIIIILLILKKGIKIEFPKYMWLFIFYIIFTRFIWGLTTSFWDTVSVSILGFFITLGFACRYFNLKYGIKIYRFLAFIACVFFIIQEISYSLWGYSLTGLLPGVPLSFTVENENYAQFLQYHFKQASFFREPAYFAQFLLPMLVIELFNKHSNMLFYLNSILITVVILLSASGCGYVGLVVIWLSWLFFERRSVFQFKKAILIGLLIAMVLFYGPGYLQSLKGNALTKRFYGVLTVDEESISSFTRVYRGYYVFGEYSIIEKIIGINNPQMQREKSQRSPVRDFFGEELYFNGIQSLLILTGFIGLMLMFFSYKSLWLKQANITKVLLLTLITQSLIEAIFINAAMLLYITLLYSFNKDNVLTYDKSLSWSRNFGQRTVLYNFKSASG